MLVIAESEEQFVRLFDRLNENFRDIPQVFSYVKITWIDKYKERFVAYWTNTVIHFENTISNWYDLVAFLFGHSPI